MAEDERLGTGVAGQPVGEKTHEAGVLHTGQGESYCRRSVFVGQHGGALGRIIPVGALD